MGSLRAVLNRVERHYWEEPPPYHLATGVPDDADALIYYLFQGVRAEERRYQRLREGKSLPEDRKREEIP
jgi:hypothetical protein